MKEHIKDNKRKDTTHRKGRVGRIMKIAEAKRLTPKEFAKLDEAYSGFEAEKTRNHPARDGNETFMEFIKRGSKKLKSDPTVKKILD